MGFFSPSHQSQTRRWLLVIVLIALALRVGLLVFIQHPGVADPNHYFNVARRLVEGEGFTFDYVWMYSDPPESIVHPEDHWMPLTSAVAAVPMALFGVGVHTALIPFILLGSLLPVIGYLAARQLGVSFTSSLFTAAAVGLLPEFVLNSLRTDTTVPNAVLVCGSVLLLTEGFSRRRLWMLVASGVLAGLSYLTRNDGLLLVPMVAVVLVIYAFVQKKTLYWAGGVAFIAAAAIVVAPWIMRNIQVLGIPTTAEARHMFFFTSVLDHYAYDRDFTLETMLANQSAAEIIGKRAFELAAAAKLAYTTLDVFLPVAVVGGGLLFFRREKRERWLVLAPALVLLIGFVIAYPILIPYKSQAGSFKKAYLTLIPLIVPLAGYAFDHAGMNRGIRNGAMLLALVFLAANAVELVRADARWTVAHMTNIERVVEVARSLPDTNEDGAIILMAQDPFMLKFFDMRSVMIPHEDRETVLMVAEKYGVDYLLMPPDRPALDPIYVGDENDPRFRLAARVPGTDFALYALESDIRAIR